MMAVKKRYLCCLVTVICLVWYELLAREISNEETLGTSKNKGEWKPPAGPGDLMQPLHSHTEGTLTNTSDRRGMSGDDAESQVWASEQQRRQQAVREACRGHQSTFKYNLPRSSSALNYLLVDDRHKAIYCFVPKVACTNWKRLWMVLTGLKKDNDHVMKMPKTLVHRHHEMMMLIKQPHSTRVLLKKLNTYTKLLVVRDPYQRLLSAYRDKFEDKGEEFYIKNYAPVIRTFRQNVSDSRSPKPDTGVTFSEFVSYILSLPKTSFDEHWRPYQQLCFPCDIHYDVIGKYETLVKDSEHFLRLIGAPETLHFPAYAPSRTSELLQAYMASLSHHQRQGLRKVYEMDFEMFQYRDKL